MVELVGFIVKTENFRLWGEVLRLRVGRWGEVFKVRVIDISPLLVFTIFYKLHLYLVIFKLKKIT